MRIDSCFVSHKFVKCVSEILCVSSQVKLYNVRVEIQEVCDVSDYYGI